MSSKFWLKFGLLLALGTSPACRLLSPQEFTLPLALLQEKVQIELSLMQFDARLRDTHASFDRASLDRLADFIRPNLPDLIVLQGLQREVLGEVLKRLPAYHYEELTWSAEELPQIPSVLLFRSDRFEAETGRDLDVFIAPRSNVQRVVEKASGKTVFVGHGFWTKESPENTQEFEDMYAHLKQKCSPSDAILLVGKWEGNQRTWQDQSMVDVFTRLYPQADLKGPIKAQVRGGYIYCENKHCKPLSAEILQAMGPGPEPFLSQPIMGRLRIEAIERDRSWKIARKPLKSKSY